jgi:hypothetical protein
MPLLVPFLFVYPNRFFHRVAFSFSEIGLFLSRFRVFSIAVVHNRNSGKSRTSERDPAMRNQRLCYSEWK